MILSEQTRKLAERAEADCRCIFEKIDAVSQYNTEKVLTAFQNARVSDAMFAGTTGYGYDDIGRDTLDAIYAEVFHAEAALVRLQFVNGTHALTCALFGMLRPGDLLVSAAGAPYDTLQTAIGITGNATGSLKEYGVSYAQADLNPDGHPDYDRIAERVKGAKAVLIQRSRGYSTREALSIAEIRKIITCIRAAEPGAAILVDNCYGEFTDTEEPLEAGADLIAGSLIKNPGGGLAVSGGYIAGRKTLVDAAAYRLTVPGIGGECGATFGQNRLLFQGFFLAPHVTAQALKTAVFCARMMELLGFASSPRYDSSRSDIVQTVSFGSPELLEAFCRGVQAGAPVDSFVTPVAWNMPGYEDPVIMAAGAFVQGASIELSADGPMRAPFTAYLQGGLTFESGKLGIQLACEELVKRRDIH